MVLYHFVFEGSRMYLTTGLGTMNLYHQAIRILNEDSASPTLLLKILDMWQFNFKVNACATILWPASFFIEIKPSFPELMTEDVIPFITFMFSFNFLAS